MPLLCPECKAQYRKGILTCSDCNVPLIVVRRTNDKYIGNAYIRDAQHQRQELGDKLVRKSIGFTKAISIAILIFIVEYYFKQLISLQAWIIMSVVGTIGLVVYAQGRRLAAVIETMFDIDLESFLSRLKIVRKGRRKKR